MTTVRKGRRYIATVARGEATQLQGDKSDVRLTITAGCPRRAHLMEVRTDLTNFSSKVPHNECFIAPVVDILAPARTESSAYILRIPHCLHHDDDRNNVKVRMLLGNRVPAHAVVMVPPRDKCMDGVLFFEIDDRFLELHTPHFCTIICTICKTDTNCLKRATSFIFGKVGAHDNNGNVESIAEIRPYFSSTLFEEVTDFRQVRHNEIAFCFYSVNCREFLQVQIGIHTLLIAGCCLNCSN